MTDDINERISALLDNELESNLTSTTLTQLQGDEALRNKWDRYHLIGDAMRGEAVRLSAESIADRVRTQIDNEPPNAAYEKPIPLAGRRSSFPRWSRTAGGALLAASVAAITVVTFPQLTGTESGIEPQMVVENTRPASQAPYLIQSSTRWKNLSEPKVESKLNRYLIDHNEYVAPGGIGVIPYTSFVSYDTER
jgi:sigma-E factor negative regulatory protein RseA